MCGVVGYTGDDLATDIIYEGLLRLEYRGYDSAGIAVCDGDGIHLAKKAGKIRHLRAEISSHLPPAHCGIGHTRWATHGPPNDENAHPHPSSDGKVVITHNGIIENYLEIKDDLIEAGYQFKSETDSEVIAHLIQECYKTAQPGSTPAQGSRLLHAVLAALRQLEGAFAITVLHRDHPDTIIGCRRLSPLIVGIGEDENFFASDATAIISYTRSVHYLNDEEVAEITPKSVNIFDLEGDPVEINVQTVDWNPILAERGGYDHFMLKEILEQPEVLRNTLGTRTDRRTGRIILDDLGINEEALVRINRVYFIACGTAFYAGCVGRYLFEALAGISCEAVLASEFRYGDPVLDDRTLVVGISQSGETADTLAALRRAKGHGVHTIAICNVKGSTISREVDATLYIHAGPEIGVASTKAYTAMLMALNLLAVHVGTIRNRVDAATAIRLIDGMRGLPGLIDEYLKSGRAPVEVIARKYFNAQNFLFLGRYVNFPTALEGALKLKEISYIHAEGYAAGEMKHGPIALVDGSVPVLAIATKGRTYDKVLSNMQEVKARGGRVIALATQGDDTIRSYCDDVLEVPETEELLSPIINVVPLQLLAYHIANLRGADVDQPRNLAKSVTVE